jgi:Amt family ammonium transporter
MHPIGAFITGAIAGGLFVAMFQVSTNKWQIDDVLGVWALHGLCGLWGGIACGIFGLTMFGGMGGVSFWSQLVGSVMGAAYAAIAGFIVYSLVDIVFGFRMSAEDERRGADLSIHKIGANPEEDVRMGRV